MSNMAPRCPRSYELSAARVHPTMVATSDCDSPVAERKTATTPGAFTSARTLRINEESNGHSGPGAVSRAARVQDGHNGSSCRDGDAVRHAGHILTAGIVFPPPGG